MSREAVVLGGSAGALPVLAELLDALPPRLGVPLVAVLHLAPHRPSLLAAIFGRRLGVPVNEAEDKAPVTPGVWFAPPGYHLLVEADRHFALSLDAPVQFARPSVDVLFASAARAYGHGLVALLLSGANEDGADGVREVLARGGAAFVQAPDGASSPEMPRAGARAGAQPRSLEELVALVAALPEAPLGPAAPRRRRSP